MFDVADLLTSSDDDNSLGYTAIMASLSSSDYEDITDSEEKNEIGDEHLEPSKTEQKTPLMPHKKDKGGKQTSKERRKMTNKGALPIFFHTWSYDKNGILKKRRKPTWKVKARKKFKGYYITTTIQRI